MRVEHVAFNVEDPLAMARWYVDHLGFQVKRRVMEAPWAHFLIDETGNTMLEIYGNKNVQLPDYRNMHPGILHLAFVSKDLEADAKRLCDAGGTLDGGITQLPGGDTMVFVRDPWGFTLQLVRRATPML